MKWKTHSSGLEVSSTGRVKNHDGIKMNKKGYLVVKKVVGHIRGNVHIGKGDRFTRTFYIHRLVATLFIDKPRGRHVNHKNGIKTVNRKSNLEWTTRAGNAKHAHETGLIEAKGEGNGRSVLTEKIVRRLLKLDPGSIEGTRNFARREYAKELAEKLGVSDTSIVNVWNRRTWTHVQL